MEGMNWKGLEERKCDKNILHIHLFKIMFRKRFLHQVCMKFKLANLYVRLHLLYSAPTDLQIHSEEGKYTNIVLILPCVD